MVLGSYEVSAHQPCELCRLIRVMVASKSEQLRVSSLKVINWRDGKALWILRSWSPTAHQSDAAT